MSRGLSAPEKLSDCVARRAYVVRIRCGSTEPSRVPDVPGSACLLASGETLGRHEVCGQKGQIIVALKEAPRWAGNGM